MFQLSIISVFSEVLTGSTYIVGLLSTRQKKKIERLNSVRTLPSPTVEGKAVDVKMEYVDEKIGHLYSSFLITVIFLFN